LKNSISSNPITIFSRRFDGLAGTKKSPIILRFFVKTRFSYSTTLLLRIGTLSSRDPDFVTAERELEPGYQVARSRIQRGLTQAQ
jgi:hypothetical protein